MTRPNSIYLALVAVLLSPLAANADPVDYFNDGAFVDTSNEAINLRAELVGLGHSPSDFTGTSDAIWAAVLGSSSRIVIPELERGNLVGALSAATQSAIASWVGAGGGLILSADGSGNGINFLNTIFGFALTGGSGVASGSSALNAAAAAGTSFAGGPDPLAVLNGTFFVNSASLPVGALDIYNGTGSLAGNTSVFVSRIGSGYVSYIAYDWFAGVNPSGWGKILDSSVRFEAVAVPEPGTLALFGIGLLGMGLARRKKIKT